MPGKIKIVDIPYRSDSKWTTETTTSRFTMKPGPKSIKITITSTDEAIRFPEPQTAKIESTELPADYGNIDDLADELLIQLGMDPEGEDIEQELGEGEQAKDVKGKGKRRMSFFRKKGKESKPLPPPAPLVQKPLPPAPLASSSTPSMASIRSQATAQTAISSTSDLSTMSAIKPSAISQIWSSSTEVPPTPIIHAKSPLTQVWPAPSIAEARSSDTYQSLSAPAQKRPDSPPPNSSPAHKAESITSLSLEEVGALLDSQNRDFHSYEAYGHQPRDVVYANIYDLSQDSSTPGLYPLSRTPKFPNLIRRIQKYTDIRLAAAKRPITRSGNGNAANTAAEPLGSVLAPPEGCDHFDVQLTICGLLQKEAASPYELYWFFVDNGFFAHQSAPPLYGDWSARYGAAVKGENLLYREGIRAGITGEMDFLRGLFREWADRWHDWRLERPIPRGL